MLLKFILVLIKILVNLCKLYTTEEMPREIKFQQLAQGGYYNPEVYIK